MFFSKSLKEFLWLKDLSFIYFKMLENRRKRESLGDWFLDLYFNIYLVFLPRVFLYCFHLQTLYFLTIELSYLSYLYFVFVRKIVCGLLRSPRVVCDLLRSPSCKPFLCFWLCAYPSSERWLCWLCAYPFIERLILCGLVPCLLCRGCCCLREEFVSPKAHHSTFDDD